jgi:hypothetical protein
MNRSYCLPVFLALMAGAVSAALPVPARLLPKDTLAVFTIPDWGKASDGMSASGTGRLWADPAMKAFRDNFEKKFTEKVLGTIEKDLGIKASDYTSLARGQMTLAVVQDGWKGDPDTEPGLVMVLDTKDKAGDLKTRLEGVRRKLADAKKPLKTEKIRDVEFSSVAIDMPGDEDDEDDKKNGAKTDPKTKQETIYFGQLDTALVVSTSTKTLEKVVARVSGGTSESLAEEPAFQANEAAWFRNAAAFGWIHFVPMYKAISQAASGAEGADAMGVDPKVALKAIGLEGLKTVAMAWTPGPDGDGGLLSFSIPEAQRVGLFKMLAPSTKDSGPLPFIPADAVKFQRWRLDGQRMWATLEETLAAVSPQVNGFVQLMVAQAGKDKDPSFDLKKNVLGNLGDDIISYGKAPAGSSIEDLGNPPSVMLLASPSPENLTGGIKMAAGALGGGGGGGDDSKDREFNGKKIRSMRTPAGPGGKGGKMEMASTSGYAVFSATPALIEEVIRSAESPGKSLKDDPAMTRAAEKVGGFGTGIFGYENQRETMRSQWEFLRTGGLANLMGDGGAADWAQMFDFKLLPDYGKVSQHFGIAVFSGVTDAQGMHFRFYGPSQR